MSLWHDEELPAGYQDADLEMAELEAAGARAAALKRRGICPHGWRLGGRVPACYDAQGVADARSRGAFPDRPSMVTDQAAIPPGQDLCLDCGELVPAWDKPR